MNANAASPWNQSRRWLAFLLLNVVYPVLFGVIAVAMPMPINCVAFLLWLWLLASVSWDGRITQLVVLVSVVVAAHLAPVKTTDRYLDQDVSVSRTQLTLGELAEFERPRSNGRSLFMSINVSEEEKTKVIEFPETTMTLRQFVHVVESQSSLRHDFAHCGNGWTILWGGDCSFGMHMYDPSR